MGDGRGVRHRLRHVGSIRARTTLPAVPDDQGDRHGHRRLRDGAVRKGVRRPRGSAKPPGRRNTDQAGAAALPRCGERSASTRGRMTTTEITEMAPLLIVEDDPALQTQMRWAFERYEPVPADDRESALAHIRRHQPAVVTMDLGLPPAPDDPSEGFQLLQDILSIAPDTKVIVLTGQNDRWNALKAIALGAYDFYPKPFQPELLALIIERAYRLHALQAENRRLQSARRAGPLAALLTRDPQMLKVCSTVEKVALTNATVMLLGESGTGKELLARGVHALSSRKDARFVAINCAAIPENLLESELFGYEKGAFTGAAKQTLGKIELAHKGTLFLDEIGDLPGALQAKILRFLQDHTIERLGGRQEIPVDVRVVCATHQDLKAMIGEGRFREVLYYRLAEIVVSI